MKRCCVKGGCQFEKHDVVLFDSISDSKTYCIFHLPLKMKHTLPPELQSNSQQEDSLTIHIKEEWPDKQIQEVSNTLLKLLSLGFSDFSNSFFVERFDIKDIDVKHLPLNFEGCHFRRGISISNVQNVDHINLRNIHSGSTFHIMSSSIDKFIDCSHSYFGGGLVINGVSFQDENDELKHSNPYTICLFESTVAGHLSILNIESCRYIRISLKRLDQKYNNTSSINLKNINVDNLLIDIGRKFELGEIRAEFKGVVVNSNFSIEGSEFTNHVDFSTVIFGTNNNRQGEKAVAPNFFECDFYQGVTFPPPYNFLDRSTQESESRYLNLKQLMSSKGDKQQTTMFYALQQESMLRVRGKDCHSNWLSWVYCHYNYYGYNPFKFTVWLTMALTFLLAFIVFSGFNSTCYFSINGNCSISFSIVEETFIDSIIPMFAPFHGWKGLDVTSLAKVLKQILSTIFSILFIAQYSLILMAVRKRFKQD